MYQTRIALVDDHSLFRKGTKMLLEMTKNYIVILEAQNGKDFFCQLENASLIPDIVLIDIRMPEMDGYETVRNIKEGWPSIKTLVVTDYDHEYTTIKMLKTGVNGILLKSSTPETLYDAIDSIKTNGYYYSENISKHIFNLQDSLYDLSSKEVEFLKYCSSELTYKEISERMYLSNRTIDSIRDSLFEKLKVSSRVGLVVFSMRCGLV
jgi:two-component system, NarL family, invasion response regulator UvrY